MAAWVRRAVCATTCHPTFNCYNIYGELVIFECVDKRSEQNELRKSGFKVIGESQLGDKLEANPEFGQQTQCSIGLPTASSYSFSSYAEAIDL